jgi:large subunit ribosomal protein L30
MLTQLHNKGVLVLIKYLMVKTMAKIKITRVKGLSGHSKRQIETLKALGLHRLNSTVEKEQNPAIMGMVEKVRHLIVTENI